MPDRLCDRCGHVLPPASKMSTATLPLAEAQPLTRRELTPDPDGNVTLDLCLNCRIWHSQSKRGLI